MPNTLVLPDIRNKLADLARRIGILERRLREDTSEPAENEIIFTLPDQVAVSTSPHAYLRSTARLVNVVCSLGTAGTSTTTVQIKKNGSTIGSINLTSGNTFQRTRFSEGFATDSDALTVAVSAAGTGAADLTVQARFT